MEALVQHASGNFHNNSAALRIAASGNQVSALLEAGLIDLLVSKLNAGSGGVELADVISSFISNSSVSPWEYPILLKAIVNRISKMIAANKMEEDEYDSLLTTLSNLIWSYDGKEEDLMRGALSEAGFHNICVTLIKKGSQDSSRMYSILINLSNTKDCAVPMARDNVYVFIMERMKAAPKNVWTDDLHGTDGGNAFDVATNLAKWASIRSQLIACGYVEVLAGLVQYENYFGFEATEGLAYIVGRSEDAKNTKLLQARERNVKLIFEVLEGSLNGNPVRFNITWSVYGRVLAIQSLSVSDGNKKLLRPAIPLLIRVLKECSDDEDSVELALQCLLELSFNDENEKDIKSSDGIVSVLEGYASSANSKIAQYASKLKFAITQQSNPTKRASATAASGDGWVMISYNWKSQPIVKALNQKLKESGINTWIDIEQMNGDTVEKMAEAVEGAKAVIVCLTENYKESGPCRLEANYAFKNRKPIIPLLMQEGYSPSGWLGLLIGNALYYPVTSEDAVPSVVPKVINDIAKQTGLASVAEAARKAAAAPSVPSHSSAAASSSSPSKPAAPSSGSAGAASPGGYIGTTFPGEGVLNMSPDDIEKWFTSKGQPKLGASLKKQQLTGKSLAIVFDMYSRGDGSVMSICKDLGAKSTAQALELLFLIRELCVERGNVTIYGPPFPSLLMQNMNEVQVEQWLFSKGQAKLGGYFKKQGVKGTALAILFDLYNRSNATLVNVCAELGTGSTAQALMLLSLLKEISNLD